MGKFTNTTRKDTIDSLVYGLKGRLDNPYYINANTSPTIVNYYSTNLERTTLDQGIKTEYEQIGKNSPFKYNLIKDFYLYGGLEHIRVELNVEDNTGLEASAITSTSTILPNIGMTPAVGDYFEITYMDNKYIFEVTTVNTDKLEDQSNMYEIEYELTDITNEDLLKQVAGTFVMDIDNLGTTLRTIVREDAYDLINILDETTVSLKNYFMNIFFSPRVETFVYGRDNGHIFYDPHLIEFIIRNGILDGSGDYIHVMQQMSVSRTFSIDYDNTFFRSLEVGSVRKLRGNIYGWGKHINQPTSVLSMHQEQYFEVKHIHSNDIVQNEIFNIFKDNLISNILSNTLYSLSDNTPILPDLDSDIEDTEQLSEMFQATVLTIPGNEMGKGYRANTTINTKDLAVYKNIDNMIIKYFNDFEISISDIDLLEDIDYYTGGNSLYYAIPIIIFILEKYILKYLANPNK